MGKATSRLTLQAIVKRLIHSQHLPYFLQITHYKRPTNSVVPFKLPSPPFNVDAGLIECHREFRTTLIRGEGGGGEQAIQ